MRRVTLRCRTCGRERRFTGADDVACAKRASAGGWELVHEARYLPDALEARCPRCIRRDPDRWSRFEDRHER
jgi:hypothetical protein